MYFVGAESTATASARTLMFRILSLHPAWQERIHAEIVEERTQNIFMYWMGYESLVHHKHMTCIMHHNSHNSSYVMWERQPYAICVGCNIVLGLVIYTCINQCTCCKPQFSSYVMLNCIHSFTFNTISAKKNYPILYTVYTLHSFHIYTKVTKPLLPPLPIDIYLHLN